MNAVNVNLVVVQEVLELIALEHEEVLECEVCGYPPTEHDEAIHEMSEEL